MKWQQREVQLRLDQDEIYLHFITDPFRLNLYDSISSSCLYITPISVKKYFIQ